MWPQIHLHMPYNGPGEELAHGFGVHPRIRGRVCLDSDGWTALRRMPQLLTRPDGFDTKRRAHRFCTRWTYRDSMNQAPGACGFIRKPEEIKQIQAQREQAEKAVYISLTKYQAGLSPSEPGRNIGGREFAQGRATQAGVKGSRESAHRRLADEIKVRHFSAKTLESCTTWVKKMQYYKAKDFISCYQCRM
jgi:hypothetical protein